MAKIKYEMGWFGLPSLFFSDVYHALIAHIIVVLLIENVTLNMQLNY